MITVKEIRRSRARTLDTEEREYVAWGSDDPSAIEVAIHAVAPTTVSGLVVTAYSQEPREEDETVYDARVTYGVLEQQEVTETGGSETSFDLSMVTSHITQGLQRINSYGTDPPDLPGINFNGERYEGIDIQVPVFTFRETHYRSAASVNSTYINKLFQCASNPINAAAFRGFAIGEVMYLGASGSQRSASDFSITHGFAASPNLSGLSIGTITAIAKKGWEYMWVLYEKDEDTTGKFVVETPRAVYVDRTYESSNFTSLLEI